MCVIVIGAVFMLIGCVFYNEQFKYAPASSLCVFEYLQVFFGFVYDVYFNGKEVDFYSKLGIISIVLCFGIMIGKILKSK
mmetsp:Transcript_36625/g.32836  ORF Transcript_36625/g.32836 Transcript_36625/m.32836 type:complete len:80 (-) Transcript_36625:238-477(-)